MIFFLSLPQATVSVSQEANFQLIISETPSCFKGNVTDFNFISACTSHKFRPKPKPQPRKGSPTAVASTLPSVMGSPNLDTVQSVQSVDVGKGRLADQGESSLATSEILGRKEPLKSIEDPCSSVLLSDTSRSLLLGDSSQSLPVDALQSEVPVLDGSGDWHSSFGKPVGEVKKIEYFFVLAFFTSLDS